jgi:hypothetical protein
MIIVLIVIIISILVFVAQYNIKSPRNKPMGKCQCIICSQWFDESEMVGEYCQNCYLEAADEGD